MARDPFINKNINIPTRDAVIVSLDSRRLQDEEILKLEEDCFIDESKNYIRTLEKHISRTLHASTKPIYEIIRK